MSTRAATAIAPYMAHNTLRDVGIDVDGAWSVDVTTSR
jgi:hypothetical protein